jgi:hypothetical protein
VSLADLFPKLSYSVLRQFNDSIYETLVDAQEKHASQVLGENATKEFILTHVYRINPHLITNQVEFWRELLRLLNRDELLPPVLSEHVARVLSESSAFRALPLHDLCTSKPMLLRFVQEAWEKYLDAACQQGHAKTKAQEALVQGIPFSHPDIRSSVESLLLDGVLRPVTVKGAGADVPAWVKLGIQDDPSKEDDRVRASIDQFKDTLPTEEASHREWLHTSSRFGELLSHYYLLDPRIAAALQDEVQRLAELLDARLLNWIRRYYVDLPSLPAIKSPAMVHHVPRFLSGQWAAGHKKLALLVFDGMAMDQWAIVRDSVAQQMPSVAFEEGATFAWLPSLTCVSRQALFSGLKPREFSSSIGGTSQDPHHWMRFWSGQGLKQHQVYFRKGLVRSDQLGSVANDLSGDSINVVGLVVQTIDEFVHGAVLGKRGVAVQVQDWCQTGFVRDLFSMLDERGFEIYVTADHGNVESYGKGRPAEGVASERRGERVRIYNKTLLADELCSSYPGAFRLDLPALPLEYCPVFAGGDTSFIQAGEQAVVHGGLSLQEAIVPFSKVSISR